MPRKEGWQEPGEEGRQASRKEGQWWSLRPGERPGHRGSGELPLEELYLLELEGAQVRRGAWLRRAGLAELIAAARLGEGAVEAATYIALCPTKGQLRQLEHPGVEVRSADSSQRTGSADGVREGTLSPEAPSSRFHPGATVSQS